MAEVPSALNEGRRAIEDLDHEVVAVGPWQPSPGLGRGAWQLKITLQPADLEPLLPIPPVSHWFIVVDARYPRGRIKVFPAKDGGIEDTFPHQELNTLGDNDVPWRDGMLCLAHTIDGHELAWARYDPDTAYERLAWHVWRTLEWLRAASRGELIKEGEPFELPVFGNRNISGPILAYREGIEEMSAWQSVQASSGLAELAIVSDGPRRILAVREFRDRHGSPLVSVPWGPRVTELDDTRLAVWLRLGEMPIERYWRAPSTWEELAAAGDAQSLNVQAIMKVLADRIRDGFPHLVLVGFPIPATMGGVPVEYAWEAFEVAALNRDRRKTPIRGFRPAKARLIHDLTDGPLSPSSELDWVRSENWHPDHLLTRGRFEQGLSHRRVALVGAGSLGSAVGDMLIRAGVTDLTIVDEGVLEAANLARHILSSKDVSMPKAISLASHLNAANPNAHAVGVFASFPDLDESDRDRVFSADVVIDTSGSHLVIAALGEVSWPVGTSFVSLSLSFGASRLYGFVAHGARFPATAFEHALAPWSANDIHAPEEFPWEGIGCWSSVFPARHDHVVQLAASGVSWLDERLATPVVDPELVVWERGRTGTVTVVSESPSS